MIPTIDFSEFLHGSTSDRRRIASRLDNALSTVGSFYIYNHGIEQSRIDKCFELCKPFFDLPEHDKAVLSSNYCSVGREIVHGQKILRESFGFHGPNDFPFANSPNVQLSSLHDIAAEFSKDCHKLHHDLLECASIALDLNSEEYLNKYHTSSNLVTSFSRYPAIPTSTIRPGDVVRNPAHADLGTFTFLFQDDVGGLEVADMSSTDKSSTSAVERMGTFIHVEPKPGAILVHTGFLLMHWTNRRWKNTVHRVVAPPSCSRKPEEGNAETIPERYSIAFFGSPDPSTVVETLPSCYSEPNPYKWGPIHVEEYLQKKRSETLLEL